MIHHRTHRTPPQRRADFARLIALWAQAGHDGGAIDVAAFKIWSDPDLLANLALIDLERPNATKWMTSYRYVGAGLRRLLGRDVTGLSVGDAYPSEIADEIMGAIADCVSETGPVATRREFRLLGVVLGYDRLLLPFGRRGAVTQIAAAIYPVPGWLHDARQWQTLLRTHRAERAASREEATAMWASAIAAQKPHHVDAGEAERWYV